MIDYDGFSKRLDGALARAGELRKRLHERRYAGAALIAYHQATKATGHAMRCRERAGRARDHEYESAQMAKAFDWLSQAEHELRLADKLIAQLEEGGL